MKLSLVFHRSKPIQLKRKVEAKKKGKEKLRGKCVYSKDSKSKIPVLGKAVPV